MLGEALTLDSLGFVLQRAWHPGQAARGSWGQALEIFDDLHHPVGEQVRARLGTGR